MDGKPKVLENWRIILIVVLGILLISCTLKTQAVVVSYGDDYSVRLEYTIYGYCIRASAGLKAAEPAISGEVYIGNSINTSVLKAVKQMQTLGGEGLEAGVFSSGYPRNNGKLEASIVEMLKENGINAKVLELNTPD